VREHQQRVFGMLLRLTGNRDNVEDLAQEVFLRLYRGWSTFAGRRSSRRICTASR